MAAYPAISFPRFALGAFVVAIPAMLLEQGGHNREAWLYIGLILLMMVVFYANGLTRAAAFTSSVLRKK